MTTTNIMTAETIATTLDGKSIMDVLKFIRRQAITADKNRDDADAMYDRSQVHQEEADDAFSSQDMAAYYLARGNAVICRDAYSRLIADADRADEIAKLAAEWATNNLPAIGHGAYAVLYIGQDGDDHCRDCAVRIARGEYGLDYRIIAVESEADREPQIGGIICANCNHLLIEDQTDYMESGDDVDGMPYEDRSVFGDDSDIWADMR